VWVVEALDREIRVSCQHLHHVDRAVPLSSIKGPVWRRRYSSP
jgi:hypothetical protein